MRGVIFFAGLLAAIAIVGCSDDSSMSTSSTTPPALTISPADAETGVRLDAPVKMTFNRPVDRDVIESGFHLISESALMDSTCTDSLMTHSQMMDCMDETVMHHMEQYHSTQGQYTWNEASTACTFQPGEFMDPSTRYMMHMDSGMTEEAGMHACCTGMMDGHGSGAMDGTVTMHFTTMAASGGHDGHH